MGAFQIVLFAALGLLALTVLGWMLRPRISSATVTERIQRRVSGMTVDNSEAVGHDQ